MQNAHVIQIDSERCIGCGLCKADCPHNNLVLREKKAVVRAQDCLLCGHCVAICPQNAVQISGYADAPEPVGADARLDDAALLHALKASRSVRHFTGQTVAPAVLARIIEAGRYTPTAKNAQCVGYVVLSGDLEPYEAVGGLFLRRLKRVVDVFSKGYRAFEIDAHFFFKQAPAAILVVAPNAVDGALAAANMALMAQAQGLGVLYSGFFTAIANRSPKLKRMLALPGTGKVVTTLVLGYPAVKYPRTAQRETPVVVMK